MFHDKQLALYDEKHVSDKESYNHIVENAHYIMLKVHCNEKCAMHSEKRTRHDED